MSGDIFTAVLVEGLKVLFLLGLPILIAVSLGGILVAALQGATAIHDSASAYAVRILALVAVLYLMFPLYSRSLVSLATMVFR